jgi:hypothetical protein
MIGFAGSGSSEYIKTAMEKVSEGITRAKNSTGDSEGAGRKSARFLRQASR